MWLRGGASAGSASANAATAAGAPSASTSTPAEVLRTQPRTPAARGERVDEGPEADALDDAADADAHGGRRALVAGLRQPGVVWAATSAHARQSGQRNW